jgi:hypothetical protein
MNKQALISLLGDTPEVQQFIGYVQYYFQRIESQGWLPEKMKKPSAEHKQITRLYEAAKELEAAFTSLNDESRLRLSCSGWWDVSRLPYDIYDLMFAAGHTLDNQSLRRGESQTLNEADIARVRVIAHGFRTFLKGRAVSASESSLFYRVVCELLGIVEPKRLIEKACRL